MKTFRKLLLLWAATAAVVAMANPEEETSAPELEDTMNYGATENGRRRWGLRDLRMRTGKYRRDLEPAPRTVIDTMDSGSETEVSNAEMMDYLVPDEDGLFFRKPKRAASTENKQAAQAKRQRVQAVLGTKSAKRMGLPKLSEASRQWALANLGRPTGEDGAIYRHPDDPEKGRIDRWGLRNLLMLSRDYGRDPARERALRAYVAELNKELVGLGKTPLIIPSRIAAQRKERALRAYAAELNKELFGLGETPLRRSSRIAAQRKRNRSESSEEIEMDSGTELNGAEYNNNISPDLLDTMMPEQAPPPKKSCIRREGSSRNSNPRRVSFTESDDVCEFDDAQ